MPRNTRNFWIEADIDGRHTDIASGPRHREGGFRLRIYQRERGGIRTAYTVVGFVDFITGDLTCEVTAPRGRYDDCPGEKVIGRYTTQR
jgi:hypothetical protein